MFFDLVWFLRTINGLKISYLLAFHTNILEPPYILEFSYCAAFMLQWAKKAKRYLPLPVENASLRYVRKKRLCSSKCALIDKTYNYSDSLVVLNEMKFCMRDRDTDNDIDGQSCAQIALIWKFNRTCSRNSLFGMNRFWSQLTAILERLTETLCL